MKATSGFQYEHQAYIVAFRLLSRWSWNVEGFLSLCYKCILSMHLRMFSCITEIHWRTLHVNSPPLEILCCFILLFLLNLLCMSYMLLADDTRHMNARVLKNILKSIITKTALTVWKTVKGIYLSTVRLCQKWKQNVSRVNHHLRRAAIGGNGYSVVHFWYGTGAVKSFFADTFRSWSSEITEGKCKAEIHYLLNRQ